VEFDKFVSKSWGWERWLVNGPLYCGKLLFVARNQYCSFHYHKKKTETFWVLMGSMQVRHYEEADMDFHGITTDEGMVESRRFCNTWLRPQMFIHLPAGTRHQFFGLEDTLFLEISTEHDDADTYRIGTPHGLQIQC
jgi:mannose-6-phosphate isomerase